MLYGVVLHKYTFSATFSEPIAFKFIHLIIVLLRHYLPAVVVHYIGNALTHTLQLYATSGGHSLVSTRPEQEKNMSKFVPVQQTQSQRMIFTSYLPLHFTFTFTYTSHIWLSMCHPVFELCGKKLWTPLGALQKWSSMWRHNAEIIVAWWVFFSTRLLCVCYSSSSCSWCLRNGVAATRIKPKSRFSANLWGFSVVCACLPHRVRPVLQHVCIVCCAVCNVQDHIRRL